VGGLVVEAGSVVVRAAVVVMTVLTGAEEAEPEYNGKT